MRFPDVAVAEYGDRTNRLFQLSNRFPPRLTGVMLLHGAGMQRNRGHAFFSTDLPGTDVHQPVVEETHPEFGGDRDAVRGRAFHRCADNRAEQLGSSRHRRTAALAGDLGGRASEVDVDVVNAATVTEDVDGLPHYLGIRAIKLLAAWLLAGTEADHPFRLGVLVDDRRRHRHFVDVDESGRKFAAHLAKRRVGNTRHRGEHHGSRQLMGTNRKRHYPKRYTPRCYRTQALTDK